MNQNLNKQLITDYPELFTVKNFRAMPDFYIECNDGWFNIINTLCRNIHSHHTALNRIANQFEEAVDLITNGRKDDVDPWILRSMERINNDPDEKYPEFVDFPTFAQIKEKFGSLNIYIDGADAETTGMVAMAEGMSHNTCEQCGNVGERRKGSWIKILCDNHAA